MKSLRLRSAIIASIASLLICTMLLGSILISNVYAKGSGSEKSKYNLDENCKDDHKGQQITLTGTRNIETIDTDTNQKSKNEIDLDKTADKDGLDGEKGVIINNAPALDSGAIGSFATKKSDNHFE